MLLIVSVALIMIAITLMPRIRMGRVDPASLGWMSEQWLAQYRASHSA